MPPDTSDADLLPTLDDDPVPFERPARRTGGVARARKRKNKKRRAAPVGLFALVYALGAVGIGVLDHGGWYLLVWLVTGPVTFGVVRAIRARPKPLRP